MGDLILVEAAKMQPGTPAVNGGEPSHRALPLSRQIGSGLHKELR
jgi:hypothetical protein